MRVAHVEFLVEEPSAEAMLYGVLPRLIGGTSFRVHAYQGKSDLMRKLPSRLRSGRDRVIGRYARTRLPPPLSRWPRHGGDDQRVEQTPIRCWPPSPHRPRPAAPKPCRWRNRQSPPSAGHGRWALMSPCRAQCSYSSVNCLILAAISFTVDSTARAVNRLCVEPP